MQKGIEGCFPHKIIPYTLKRCGLPYQANSRCFLFIAEHGKCRRTNTWDGVLSPSPLGLLGLGRKAVLSLRVSTERSKKRYPGVTCDCTIASGHAASHHTQSEPPLRLPQPKSGAAVRAEKRRGVSFETTSTKAFPGEDQPQMLHLTLLITLRGYT